MRRDSEEALNEMGGREGDGAGGEGDGAGGRVMVREISGVNRCPLPLCSFSLMIVKIIKMDEY